MRVVTFNVWNTEGDPRRIGLINRELRRLDPDLISLQEVVRTPHGDDTRERGVDQLPALLDETGLHATHQSGVLSSTPPGGDRYGGCALATRWPHRVVEALDLRGADAPDVPWATLAALVAMTGGSVHNRVLRCSLVSMSAPCAYGARTPCVASCRCCRSRDSFVSLYSVRKTTMGSVLAACCAGR